MKVVGRRSKKWLIVGVLALVLAGALSALILLRIFYPVYSIEPNIVFSQTQNTDEEPDLAWPAYGQAAIATETQGIVVTNGEQVPHPTASTAKVITALAILEEHPLEPGEQGPTLTMTQADVESYDNYVAQNGTNTPVYVGLEITQHQALQSIMLASSNNMSDTLAIWAFGSIEGYHDYANEMVERLGATQTTIAGDASGLSAATISTASDMALISLAALDNPVLAEIATQSRADVPHAGVIENTNRLLEHSEITGLKTGETVEAGGNFLLGANYTDGDESQRVVVVVYGAPLASIAIPDSYALYESAKPYIQYEEIITRGDAIAEYDLPDGTLAQATASQPIRAWMWAGMQPEVTVSARPVTQDTEICSNVGMAAHGDITTPLRLIGTNGRTC